MRKYTSAAGLGIGLTWFWVLGAVMAVALIQGAGLFLGGELGREDIAVEELMENVAFAGRLGFGAVALAVYAGLAERKSNRMGYTLRRLAVPEWKLAMLWAVLFGGYFLVYWLSQLGVLTAVFRCQSGVIPQGENAWFVASFRSPYFHYLMPLYEPWGWVRNITLCLTLSSAAVLGAWSSRRGWGGNSVGFLILLMILMGVTTPNRISSRVNDILFVAGAWIVTVGDWFRIREGMRNEEKD